MKYAVFMLVVVCARFASGAVSDAAIAEAERLQLEGKYAEAAAVLRDALGKLDRSSQTGPSRAALLNSLGAVAQDEGDFVRAEHFYLQSVHLIDKSLGKEHLELAAALDNLGSLYLACGRRTESERFRRRALAIRVEMLGPDHPSVAKVLANLAAVAWSSGRSAEARELAERARAIYEKNGTHDGLDQAPLYSVLGLAAFKERDFTTSRVHLQRALAIYEAGAGADSPAVIRPMANLGALDVISGRQEAGEASLRMALALAERILGPANRVVADVLANYAGALRRTGRVSEAKPLEQRARAIRTQHAADTVMRHTIDAGQLGAAR